ncbi:acyltransferase [Leptospira perolatii]|uniref:Acyltransferase n=1 Tax=Leptospira perolatii TaxID=2023191 RepID=A0A2M9ZMN5_9LEPT|nr:MBOAT family O-acyltransferase [Leptospira perolatii]PJZ70163.1 acyltransferase [Leptospira perolatii]PJZ73352.1 acyltransferase [Leptospira perolatii]
MSFTTIEFLLFFLVVYLVYWNLPDRFRRSFLVFASSVFYAVGAWQFLIHLWLVLSINWLLLRYFLDRKWFLPTTIGFNVLNLAFFKYFYFIMDSVGGIISSPALQNKVSLDAKISQALGWSGFEIVLPMTISYYTFQFISLAVDKKKGLIEEPISFRGISSYILLFPVMIAGPILRYKDVSGQFDSPRMTSSDLADGLWLILFGLLKKSVLSVLMTGSIFPVFAEPAVFSGWALLRTIYFFAIYLYLDFSGLTDLARGIGRLLGLKLPENFKAPFFMDGFGDFWRRWHLTFSFWIRDYLYIPLGGSRSGTIRTCLNYLVAFGLGGLWHGASTNYLLWGLFTGGYLSAERVMKDLGIRLLPEIPYFTRIVKYIFVLHVYCISWILFFTPSVGAAFDAVARIFTWAGGQALPNWEPCVSALLIAMLFHASEEWPEKFALQDKTKKRLLPFAWIVLLLVLLGTSAGNADFFYGRF